MSRVVGITSNTIEYLGNNDDLIQEIVTQIAFDNGEVLVQYGISNDWKQNRAAEVRGDMVGVCKDCQKAIWAEQDWDFSVRDKWMSHSYEEDCIKQEAKEDDKEKTKKK